MDIINLVGWLFLFAMGMLTLGAVGIAFWETYKIVRMEFKD